jgi:hypothetical protein
MKVVVWVSGAVLIMGALLYWFLPDIIIFRLLLGHGF